MRKLFIKDIKGYSSVYSNVNRVKISKIDGKNHLIVYLHHLQEEEIIPLNEIRLCYLINIDTMEEYFRYTK